MKLLVLFTAGALACTSLFAQDNKLSLKSDSLKINGDLRIRYENRARDISGTKDSRNRLRTRFRLATSFATTDGWNVHAGLATGGTDGTSTNDTWNESSTWETGDIRLDYAYAEKKFETGTKVLIGQQKNPYKSAGMLWDDDLRPTGISFNQEMGPAFVTAGYYNLKYSGKAALGDLYAIQGGIQAKGDVSYTAALGYFQANDQYAVDMFGSTTNYSFQVVDLFADVNVKVADGVKVGGFLEAGQNLGVDNGDTQLTGAPAGYNSEDNNTFYNLGVKAQASIVKAAVKYFHVEGDSVFGGLSNSDLGDVGVGATDVQGFEVAASVNVTKNASFGVSYWKFDSIERDDQKGSMYRLEAVYKF